MRQVHALKGFFECLLSALRIECNCALHEGVERGGLSEDISQQVLLACGRVPVKDQNFDVFAMREDLLNTPPTTITTLVIVLWTAEQGFALFKRPAGKGNSCLLMENKHYNNLSLWTHERRL
jgi:hypothetical protein